MKEDRLSVEGVAICMSRVRGMSDRLPHHSQSAQSLVIINEQLSKQSQE